MDDLLYNRVTNHLKVSQVIALVMLISNILIGLLIFVLHEINPPVPAGTTIGMVSVVLGLVAGGASLIAALILPAVIVKSGKRRIAIRRSGRPKSTFEDSGSHDAKSWDKYQLCILYLASNVAYTAMLEGGAFINLVALMKQPSNYNAIVVVVLVFLMLLRFPTLGQVLKWTEAQPRKLADYSPP